MGTVNQVDLDALTAARREEWDRLDALSRTRRPTGDEVDELVTRYRSASADLADIKTISLVSSDGTFYYPTEIYPEFGIEPFTELPGVAVPN